MCKTHTSRIYLNVQHYNSTFPDRVTQHNSLLGSSDKSKNNLGITQLCHVLLGV